MHALFRGNKTGREFPRTDATTTDGLQIPPSPPRKAQMSVYFLMLPAHILPTLVRVCGLKLAWTMITGRRVGAALSSDGG